MTSAFAHLNGFSVYITSSLFSQHVRPYLRGVTKTGATTANVTPSRESHALNDAQLKLYKGGARRSFNPLSPQRIYSVDKGRP